MTRAQITTLTDIDLLAETARVVDRDCRTTAELLDLLAEVDTRKLFLGQSCSSLFTYCTQILHLSESAAGSRITAARAARRFPIIIRLLADGAVTLTTITLLTAHLTDENHEVILDAARHKSKRDIERLVATLDPQPDVLSSIRKLPTPAVERRMLPASNAGSELAFDAHHQQPAGIPQTSSAPIAHSLASHRRSIVAPLAPERYLVKITIDRQAHDKLQRARDLLRHSIPNGDPAAIVDRALTVLIAQLELRCRAHNVFEAELFFGRSAPVVKSRAGP